MKTLILAAALALAAPAAADGSKNVRIDHELKSIQGTDVKLSDYRGKALLLVNVASKCGYTPQYDGLQKLWDTYRERGLIVIGIPSNDFGGQEPGTHEEIQSFCKLNHGVTFPLMAKVHARGPEMAPVYRTLTEETQPPIRGPVKWNFTKFLIDPEGRPVARFEPKVEPMSPEVTAAVEKVLPARR